jgi:tetratricopeptide (TPR) repeat protein
MERTSYDEAIAEGKRAVELAPLDLSLRTALAEQYQQANRVAEAEKECREVLRIDPNFARGHAVMSWIYEYSGRPELAIAEQKEFLTLVGASLKEIDALDRAYRTGGMTAVHRGDIEEYLKQSPPCFYDLAMLYAAVGEREKALDFLQKAYDDRDGSMVFLAVANELDPVRRMNLPQLS